jgi:SnoaL-like domain
MRTVRTDDAVQELLAVEAIRRLKARYFRLLDEKAWDEFESLFTEDLEFYYANPAQQFVPPDAITQSDGRARVGRQQLLTFLRQGEADVVTVHHCLMPDITILGPDEAQGRWSMTDYTRIVLDGEVSWFRGYGGHEETYIRTTDGWRIKRSVFSRADFDPAPWNAA